MLQISAESMARRGRQREAEIGTLTVKCVGGVIEELAGETKEKGNHTRSSLPVFFKMLHCNILFFMILRVQLKLY